MLIMFVVIVNLIHAQDVQNATISEFAQSKVTIPCSLTSSSKISNNSVFWMKNGEVLKKRVTAVLVGQDTYVITPIVLFPVTFNDEGVYVCGANISGTQPILYDTKLVVKEINVTFVASPVAIKRKDRMNLAGLSGCVYTAPMNLNHHTYWLINGVRKEETVHWSSQTSYYEFPFMQIYENGYYQCVVYDPTRMRKPVVSNNATMLYFQANIGDTRISTTPTYVGDTLVIDGCIFNHTKGINIHGHWLKDGKSIKVVNSSNIIASQYKMNPLKIEVTNLNDRGVYQCAIFAYDWLPQFLKSANVTVDFKAVEVNITKQPTVVSTGTSIHLTGCSYTANRKIASQSYWLLNSSIVINPPRNDSSNGGNNYTMVPLQINSYNMTGMFQCVVFDANTMINKVISDQSTFVVVEEPRINSTKPTLKSSPTASLIIEDSHFYSPVPLSNEHVYWLKDGFEKIQTGIISLNEKNVYKIAPIHKEKFDYRNQGYYQAVKKPPGYPWEIKSPAVDVQYEDVSHSRITLFINKSYERSLSDSATIKSNIIYHISKLLPDTEISKNEIKIIEVMSLSTTEGKFKAVCRILVTNISQTQRYEYCAAFNKILTVSTLKELNVTNVQIENLDCCSSDTEYSHKGVVDAFVKTLVNKNVTFECSYNREMTFSRTCIPSLKNGPQWSAINITVCLTDPNVNQSLLDLHHVTICNTNILGKCVKAEEVSANLTRLTTSPGFVFTHWREVSVVGDIISNIVAAVQSSNATDLTNIFNDIVRIADRLLDIEIQLIAQAQINKNASTTILKDLDIFAKIMAIHSNATNKRISISRKNIGFSIVRISKSNVTIMAMNNNDISNITIESNIQPQGSFFASIIIPEQAFQNDQDMVYSYQFMRSTFFLSETTLNAIGADGKKNDSIVQSVILSASIGDTVVTSLNIPVTLQFQKIHSLFVDGNQSCQFWDFNKGKVGGWSANGCWVVGLHGNSVTCSCSHLTNFALLFDPAQSGNNPIELKIITWVGCGISISGLFFTLTIYVFFRNLHKKLPPKILICLCISLMALLITFLAGAEQTSPRIGCQAVAAIIQYFMLSTFCWMSVEAINLYTCFVKIYVRGKNSNFMYKASLYSWGLPLVIVAITAGIKPSNLGNENVCVVHGYSFYIGVLLPVCFILLVNFILLIFVMRNLSTGKPGKDKKSYLGQAKIAFICSLLIGLTWVFGIMAVGKATTFFQWVFCILNSFQGFLIFLFYVVRNRDTRRELKRLCNPSAYNSSSYSSTIKSLRRGANNSR